MAVASGRRSAIAIARAVRSGNFPGIQIDRFKRFDKNRLAGGARGVHDSLHLPPLGRAHGDHEAVVAQRDVVFA